MSQTCDAKQPRGDWRHEPRGLDGKEGPRSTTPVTTCRRRPEALGNKASPREWCPQGCGASASHERAGTRTQNNSVPSTRSKWRREKLRGDSKQPRAAVGKEKKSNQPTARRRGQPPWYVRLPSSRNSTCGDVAERRWTEPR